jgi:hypothetical protein
VKDIMCGDEAAAARSMLQISYPVRLSGFPSYSERGRLTAFGCVDGEWDC